MPSIARIEAKQKCIQPPALILSGLAVIILGMFLLNLPEPGPIIGTMTTLVGLGVFVTGALRLLADIRRERERTTNTEIRELELLMVLRETAPGYDTPWDDPAEAKSPFRVVFEAETGAEEKQEDTYIPWPTRR